jgi:hypothetical protein
MAASPEDWVEVIAPDMALTTNYSLYIDEAKLVTSTNFFGASWAKAVALRAAHEWTLNSRRGGQSGVETYLMEGRLSKSFGGVGVIRDALQLTNYGMQLQDLMTSMPGSVGGVASTTILTTYLGGGG